MTYQDFIIEYPWVDFALEIFKGVMPTVIALVSVFVTQMYISKRERRNKHRDKKQEYYETILKWLIEMKTRVFDVSFQLQKLLAIDDLEKRFQENREFVSEVSSTNTYFTIWFDTYNSIVKAFGSNVNLDDFEKAYKTASSSLMKIKDKYVQKLDTMDATEEINAVISLYKNAVDNTIALVAKEIGKIY